MHNCVTEFVGEVDPSPLVLVQSVQHLLGAHFRRDEDRALPELILNVRVNASEQKVVHHVLLVAFRCVVEQTLPESVHVVDPVLLVLDGFKDVD